MHPCKLLSSTPLQPSNLGPAIPRGAAALRQDMAAFLSDTGTEGFDIKVRRKKERERKKKKKDTNQEEDVNRFLC